MREVANEAAVEVGKAKEGTKVVRVGEGVGQSWITWSLAGSI